MSQAKEQIEAMELTIKLAKDRATIKRDFPEKFRKTCEIVHPILDKLQPRNAIDWAMSEVAALQSSPETSLFIIVAALDWAHPQEINTVEILNMIDKIAK